MKLQSIRNQIWVTVKVERGFISEARAYESFSTAKKTERRWRSRINPDYDETAVLTTNLISSNKSKKRQ